MRVENAKPKVLPLELVSKYGVPVRYIEHALASDMHESYKKLHAALELVYDFPPRDEGEGGVVLGFLSDALDRINKRFEGYLRQPYAFQVGGEKAVAELNRIMADRSATPAQEELPS